MTSWAALAAKAPVAPQQLPQQQLLQKQQEKLTPTSPGEGAAENPHSSILTAIAVQPIEKVHDRTYLVVDTGAIIKGVKLETLATDIYTIEEVLKEVKDKQAKHNLEQYPFEVKTREPHPASMKAVVDCARSTGDLGVLSMVDLKVLALAHTLHCEVLGELPKPYERKPRAAPKQKARNAKKMPKKEKKDTIDNYAASGDGGEQADCVCEEEVVVVAEQEAVVGQAPEQEGGDDDDVTAQPKKKGRGRKRRTQRSKKRREAREAQITSVENGGTDTMVEDEADGEATAENGKAPSTATNTTSPESSVDQERAAETESSDDQKGADSKDTTRAEEEQKRTELEQKTVAQEADEAGGEWITPDNVADHRAKDGGGSTRLASHDSFVVGCITGDFAMQNVLLHVGIYLCSMDGLRIRSVKQWALRCHACSVVERNVERKFCGACGNMTLNRVSVYVNHQGVETVGQFRRTPSKRGTKYAIAAPKGGRDSGNMIFCEDVYYDQLQKRHIRITPKKEDYFDPDFLFAQEKASANKTVNLAKPRKNQNQSKHRIHKKKKGVA